MPVAAIQPGDIVLLRPGERAAVDGNVISGRSEIDQSLITGETLPKTVAVGGPVYAGTLVRTGVLRVRVSAASEATLLSEISRLLENAQQARSRYLRLAERASRLYAPVVHAAALLTMIGWLIAGASLHDAVVTAIAVLIITCPCALGLAIPAAQTVASGALFGSGVLLNSGDAIERMAAVDHVIFDKTGTLTLPELDVTNTEAIPPDVFALAGRVALSSRHPVAAAVARAAKAASPLAGFRGRARAGRTRRPGWIGDQARATVLLWRRGCGKCDSKPRSRGVGGGIPSRLVLSCLCGEAAFAPGRSRRRLEAPEARHRRRNRVGRPGARGAGSSASRLESANGAPKSRRSTRLRGSTNWHVGDSRY